MMLSARNQQRVLAAMYHALRQSDPRLVARFTTFTRLTSAEAIPPFERVRAWPLAWLTWLVSGLKRGRRLVVRHFTRPGRRPGEASPRLQRVVFIPVAAALLLVVALLLLTIGGAGTRCTPPHAAGQRSTSGTSVPQLAAPASCTAAQPPASGR